MHRLRVQACSEHAYLNYYRPSCTFFDYFLGFGPKKGPQRAILALVERFSGQGGRSSKMRPNIVQRPEQHRRTRKRLLHLFSDCPRSHTSPSVALSIRIIVPGAMVVERGVHRAFGRIFDDRPPWPENRSTSSKMALFGHFWGPNSRTKPKPRHLVGKKLIFVLQTAPSLVVIS